MLSFLFRLRLLPWVMAMAVASLAPAMAQEIPQNLFNDPFEQLSSDIANCPEPVGPRLPESMRASRAHLRIERGTTCWLAGRCRLPNSYRYDPEIAAALLPRLKASAALKGTSLWVYFWSRNVFIQGCADDAQKIQVLEAMAREHPDVFTVVPAVRIGEGATLPYERMP